MIAILNFRTFQANQTATHGVDSGTMLSAISMSVAITYNHPEATMRQTFLQACAEELHMDIRHQTSSKDALYECD